MTVGAGMRGPELERALAAERAHARPLPAVLRVRDARRLRGDPLGRSGLERLRPHRQDGARPAPGRARRATSSSRRCPRARPGRGCASCSSARRGRSGVIDEVSLRVRTRAAPSAATRASSSRASAPACRRCGRWRRSTRCPTWRGLSDEAETRMSLALAARRAGCKGRLAARVSGRARTRAARRAVPRDPRLRGRRGRGRAQARAGAGAGAPQRRGRARSARRAGVAAGALPGAVPARRAAEPRRDGRDARDRHAVVERAAPARRGGGRDRAVRSQRRGRRAS